MSSTNFDPSSGPQRQERQPSPAEPAEVVDAQAEKLEAQIRALQQAGQRGANWFFWVAGLSVLNSLLIHSGAGIYFVVGMGLSLLADGLADHLAQQHPAQGVVFRAIAIGFTVLASGMVVLFGWLANKRYLSLFALGMVLYLLDGLIFLPDRDWLSIAFHGYALFCMGGGFMAYRQLNQIEEKLRQREARQVDSGERLT